MVHTRRRMPTILILVATCMGALACEKPKRTDKAMEAAVAAKVAEAMKAVEAKQAAEAMKDAVAVRVAEAMKVMEAKQVLAAMKAREAANAAAGLRVAEALKVLEAKRVAEAKKAAEAVKVLVALKVAEALKGIESRIVEKTRLSNLLDLALAESKLEEALKHVTELLVLDPTNEAYIRQRAALQEHVAKQRAHAALMKLLQAIRKEKDNSKALALCKNLLAEKTGSPEVHVLCGEVHLQLSTEKRRAGAQPESTKHLALAKSQFLKAQKIDGGNQRARFFVAEIQSQLNVTYPERRASYNKAYLCDRNSWLGLLSKARLSELEGRPDLAIRYFGKASIEKRLKKDVGIANTALCARAELYRRVQNYNKALGDIDCVLKNSKNDPDALVLRAHVRLIQGDNVGALSDLKKALALDKGNAMALGLRAHLKLLQNDQKGALLDCVAALKIDRNCYYPYRVRGELRLTGTGIDLIGAEGDFRTAVRLAPGVADNHYWYGRLLQQNDDKEGALRAYTKCVILDSGHWRALCNRGTIRRLLRDYDNALRDIDSALVLQPKNGTVYFQRSKVRWIRLRTKGIDYKERLWDEVLSDLDIAIRLQPKLSDAYGRRAFLLRRRKQPKKAFADYDRAIQLKSEDVYVWYGYRGMLHAEYSNYKKATEDFDEYLKRASSTHQIYARIQKEKARCLREMEKK
ncbi:MAG: hypothetical protein P1V97_15550 [Planctomycetota bacterium]|nr:hypothetical protein [Planctomycetota bacterium]